MKVLKVSAAGVRGIVGQGMSAEVAISFAQAFATYLDGGSVVVARDSRPSGVMMRSSVLAGLLSSGMHVIDLGVVPSPSARILMQKVPVSGGILIGAGHNPPPWNALKFLASDGSYLTGRQGQELLEIYHHSEFRKAAWNEIHPLETNDSAIELHLEALRRRFDCSSISGRKFKIAIDCCNGPCSLLTPRLLTGLGCEVVALNDNLHRPFPHYPNPTPDNMSQLESLSRAAGADIGFAHDAEGERLGIVTDHGKALHQEYTLALATAILLSDPATRGKIVTNLSTSRMIDALALKYGAEVDRTAIGPAHIAARALQVGASIAGEGSGTVILPDFQPGPDGVAAILLILQYLARSGKTISELVESLPKYYMIKENFSLPTNLLYRRLQKFRAEAEKHLTGFSLDLTDGVKLSGMDGWIHVRASSTESMLRVITEAETEERARQLHSVAQGIVLE